MGQSIPVGGPLSGGKTNETYNIRKQNYELSIAALNEQLRNLPDPEQIERDRSDFLELMKCLVALHILGKPEERREIVENVFSNRKVVRNNVELEPYSWLRTSEKNSQVLSGPLLSYTSRTSIEEEDEQGPIKQLRLLMNIKKKQDGREIIQEDGENVYISTD